MILEVAILDVRAGQESQFETAFEQARRIISSAPGYIGHELQRCLEKPNRYLLLVRWERLEDHTDGFRRSAAYQDWKRLLHHFYDPFPVVEHYESFALGRTSDT
ncbi:MAG: antibiotic biosynthesis monooxygenase [Gammaproteobacteria bacterium]|nr:antibiotic biosynthesis monooxygenase [Gammaproteobacteria bacterium]